MSLSRNVNIQFKKIKKIISKSFKHTIGTLKFNVNKLNIKFWCKELIVEGGGAFFCADTVDKLWNENKKKCWEGLFFNRLLYNAKCIEYE